MSKRFTWIDGTDFMNMAGVGTDALRLKVKEINGLNVFPVPDGDTGTNMALTLAAGMEKLADSASPEIGLAAEQFARGLFMGARGNSGVILSQLFRGFANAVAGKSAIDVRQFAAALLAGVEAAYRAVVKPVEGTILTVAKAAARHGEIAAQRTDDIGEWLAEVLKEAELALARTPEQLPVLKETGVVDAGGRGLVCIYEGFVHALMGGVPYAAPSGSAAGWADAHGTSPQAMLDGDAIEFGYCTEFLIQMDSDKLSSLRFEEAKFREELERHGDSLVLVSDGDLMKVHIHAEYPGEVMNLAMRYGGLSRIKIENMREQHARLLSREQETQTRAAAFGAVPSGPVSPEAASVFPPNGAVVADGRTRSAAAVASKPYAMVAVASGEGVAAIFRSLGVGVVLPGGQTMNPSTEELLEAIRRADAERVFLLPNNANIVMAARQAAELESHAEVIPTRSIPQGMAAALAFRAELDARENAERMAGAAESVVTGQITYAVRDSRIGGQTVRKGDLLGLLNQEVAVRADSLQSCAEQLLERMTAGGGEVLTVLAGADARPEDTERLSVYIRSAYPELETEIHDGGQPLYTYIFSLE